MESGAHFKLELGGQYHWNLHLTKEEYENPFLVFKKAFAEKTIDEFEFFLFEVIHLSLSRCIEEFDYDLITPYIYLIKMLDATQLMRERGIEKIKNNVQS
ncbi:hypothetical protein [Flavobacterium caseinilyticum]|uniref:hypothetical protein n=1 Tax=Flavobacterium caseinilyticum TaxID=2541732 RepID=UPI001A9FC511|nr:hypothetical protein [Flavobacterium caseinilyticum]